METRRLGRTGIELSVIGFGAWAIGGQGWVLAWGPQDDDESVATIHRALDAGVNWIDTAAIYGDGHSEAIVARALADRSERPLVATKGGRIDDDGRLVTINRRDHLEREFDRSRRLLGVDVIDLYQLHFVNEDLPEAWTYLAELRGRGEVRAIGLSNASVEEMRLAHSIAPIDSLQPRYSLIDRGVEAELLPFCAEHDIGVVVFSPQAGGLLTGAMTRERLARLPPDDWRVALGAPEFREPQLSRHLELVEVLRAIGARHGRTPGEVAIAWTLRDAAVTSAIVGLRRPGQVDGVAGAGDLRLGPQELAELDRFLGAARA